MQRMGYKVSVVSYGEMLERDLTKLGALYYKKYEFDSVSVISFRHGKLNPINNFKIIYSDLDNELKSLLQKEKITKYDLAHVVHPLRVGSAIRIIKNLNIPVLLTLTDYWTICPRVQLIKPNYEICNGPNGGIKCATECYYNLQQMKNRLKNAKVLFNMADIITVPSNLVKYVFENNGINKKNIQVINHGLDYRSFNKINNKIYSKNSPITFGFIGPNLKHKGVHVLIEAFSKVKLNKMKLRIYGPSLHEKDYQNELKRLSAADKRITLMGEFDYKNLSDLLSEIDIAIFPSIWYETYCLALTECLAHGVPVIASKTVGSAIEFINEESGWLFETGDVVELSKIIEKIVKNPEIINNLKKKIVYPPRIEGEAFQYERIYRKLIKD